MSVPTVLIADDDEMIRAVVRDGLEHEGYRVVEAVDGLNAIELCRADPPDVVLLDIEMPGIDGYEVLTELKGDTELRDIPVVFLTARNTMNDVVTGLRGGAHDYLKKPFEGAELLARVAAASHVKELQDELQQQNAALAELSRVDSLTGLYNRRHLDQELTRRHSDALRYGYPLSVVLLDLDHFKQVNDTYGHSAGDQVLREFAGRLRREMRGGDVGGRWGGEEFLVILPHTDLEGAFTVADRIRAATAAERVPADGQSIHVTISGGCALGPDESPEAMVKLADIRLYQAKLSGRNQIATTGPPGIG